MFISGFLSGIYDRLIVSMTVKWYQCVLEKLPENALLLDVGVGTASALLQCKDLVIEKNLRIVGIDYNSFYIDTARRAVEDQQMSTYITVQCIDIYDEVKVQSLLQVKSPQKEEEEDDDPVISPNLHQNKYFDAIYFSGSFSLLPKPLEALQSTCTLLEPEKGKIYITQTYQRHTPFLLHHVKPLLKYLTTIDFGNLVTTDEIMHLYKQSGLVIEEHEVIHGSVDNYWIEYVLGFQVAIGYNRF